jgi:hypothetical protein
MAFAITAKRTTITTAPRLNFKVFITASVFINVF